MMPADLELGVRFVGYIAAGVAVAVALAVFLAVAGTELRGLQPVVSHPEVSKDRGLSRLQLQQQQRQLWLVL